MPDLKILVADDSKTMRRILKNSLKSLGYQNVIEAEDGAEALNILYNKENEINFVITDWNMPTIDGLTFVRTVRSNPDYKEIPILMVTTKSMREDIVAAIKTGINQYIVKPFELATLRQKIDSMLQKK